MKRKINECDGCSNPEQDRDSISVNGSFNSENNEKSVTVTARNQKADELMRILQLSGLTPNTPSTPEIAPVPEPAQPVTGLSAVVVGESTEYPAMDTLEWPEIKERQDYLSADGMGDWECPNCGFFGYANSENAESCAACGYDRMMNESFSEFQPELYDAEAERNSMYCDACGGYHSGNCHEEPTCSNCGEPRPVGINRRADAIERCPDCFKYGREDEDFQDREPDDFETYNQNEADDYMNEGKLNESSDYYIELGLNGQKFYLKNNQPGVPLRPEYTKTLSFDNMFNDLGEAKQKAAVAKLKAGIMLDYIRVVPTNTVEESKMNESLTPKRENTGMNGAPRTWQNEPNEQIAGWRALVQDSEGLSQPHDMFNPVKGSDNILTVATKKNEKEKPSGDFAANAVVVSAIAERLQKKFNALNEDEDNLGTSKKVCKICGKKYGSHTESGVKRCLAALDKKENKKKPVKESKKKELVDDWCGDCYGDEPEMQNCKTCQGTGVNSNKKVKFEKKKPIGEGTLKEDFCISCDKRIPSGSDIDQCKKCYAKDHPKEDSAKKKVSEGACLTDTCTKCGDKLFYQNSTHSWVHDDPTPTNRHNHKPDPAKHEEHGRPKKVTESEDLDKQITFHQEAIGRGGKSSDTHHKKVLKGLLTKKKVAESSTPREVFMVHIPANVYAGKYYDFRTVRIKVYKGVDGVETEQDAINWVNSHKEEVLAKLDKTYIARNLPTDKKRRRVAFPAAKNVFFKPTYQVTQTTVTPIDGSPSASTEARPEEYTMKPTGPEEVQESKLGDVVWNGEPKNLLSKINDFIAKIMVPDYNGQPRYNTEITKKYLKQYGLDDSNIENVRKCAITAMKSALKTLNIPADRIRKDMDSFTIYGFLRRSFGNDTEEAELQRKIQAVAKEKFELLLKKYGHEITESTMKPAEITEEVSKSQAKKLQAALDALEQKVKKLGAPPSAKTKITQSMERFTDKIAAIKGALAKAKGENDEDESDESEDEGKSEQKPEAKKSEGDKPKSEAKPFEKKEKSAKSEADGEEGKEAEPKPKEQKETKSDEPDTNGDDKAPKGKVKDIGKGIYESEVERMQGFRSMLVEGFEGE